MRLRHFRYILMTLAIASLTMPVAAQACGGKRHCGYGCKTGVVYNENDNMFYSVPGTKRGTIYRVVDNKYIPVTTGRVAVTCQATPGWWWGTVWMSPSQECFYHVR